MKIRNLAIGLLLLILPSGAMARPVRFAVIPARTHISFDIGAIGFPNTHGEFRSFKGTVVVDLDRPDRSNVVFSVDSSSVDTHSSDLDDYIEGASFLNARQFPTISFVSTSVEKIDERTVQVTGNLTLLGVTQPARFNVQVDRLGDGTNMFGFSARGDIRRTDFGMMSGRPLVSDIVTIKVATEAVRNE